MLYAKSAFDKRAQVILKKWDVQMINSVLTSGSGVAMALVGLVVGFASPSASANLILNGGFETPNIGESYLLPGSTAITGWTVVGNTITHQDSSAYGGLGVVASEGSQFLELSGVVGRGGGVRSDAFSTVDGATYDLLFDIGAFWVGGQGSFGNVTVDLWINGVSMGSFSNILSLTSAGSDWETKSLSFIAQGSTTTLEFRSSLSTSSSNLGVGLDNVRVDRNSNTPNVNVPEPMTIALLGLGMVGMGLARRRSA